MANIVILVLNAWNNNVHWSLTTPCFRLISRNAVEHSLKILLKVFIKLQPFLTDTFKHNSNRSTYIFEDNYAIDKNRGVKLGPVFNGMIKWYVILLAPGIHLYGQKLTRARTSLGDDGTLSTTKKIKPLSEISASFWIVGTWAGGPRLWKPCTFSLNSSSTKSWY